MLVKFTNKVDRVSMVGREKDLPHSLATELIKSGLAVEVEVRMITEEKYPLIETKEDVFLCDSLGNKYTKAEFDKMDKRTSLYKELKALNK